MRLLSAKHRAPCHDLTGDLRTQATVAGCFEVGKPARPLELFYDDLGMLERYGVILFVAGVGNVRHHKAIDNRTIVYKWGSS